MLDPAAGKERDPRLMNKAIEALKQSSCSDLIKTECFREMSAQVVLSPEQLVELLRVCRTGGRGGTLREMSVATQQHMAEPRVEMLVAAFARTTDREKARGRDSACGLREGRVSGSFEDFAGCAVWCPGRFGERVWVLRAFWEALRYCHSPELVQSVSHL